MWAHPGKKLLFMGQEFAQDREWNFNGELDWHLLDGPCAPRACRRSCATATGCYRAEPALHERDCEPEGFRWIVVDDAPESVFAWLRFGGEGDAARGRRGQFHAGAAPRLPHRPAASGAGARS